MRRKNKIIYLVVGIFIALVIGVYAANPEAMQGAMKFFKIPRVGTTTETKPAAKEALPVTKRPTAATVDNKVGIDMSTVNKFFKDTLSRSSGKFRVESAPVQLSLETYDAMKEHLGTYKTNHENYKKHLAQVFSPMGDGKGEGEGEDPDPPPPEDIITPEEWAAMTPQERLKFILDHLNWDNYGDPETPTNYVVVFPYGLFVRTVNVDSINEADPNTWPYVTAIVACAVGDQPVEINSAAFEADGGYDYGFKFQGWYTTYSAAGTPEFQQMWPQLMDTNGGAYWAGDVMLPKTIKLDPTTNNFCTAFAFKYADFNKHEYTSDRSYWNQFALRGLRNQVAGDIKVYRIWDGNTMQRIGYSSDSIFSSNRLLGHLNVFKWIKDLIVRNFDTFDMNYAVGFAGAWIGEFYFETPPNAKAHIDSVNIDLESTYPDDTEFDVSIGLQKEYDTSHYNGWRTSSAYDQKKITFHKGTNTVPLDIDMSNAQRLSLWITVDELPETTGDLRFNLTGIESDSTSIYTSNYTYYFDDPIFTTVPGNRIHVIDVDEGDPILHLNYSPRSTLWYGTGDWFDQKSAEGGYGLLGYSLTLSPPPFFNEMTAKVNQFDIDVLGNFTQPLSIKLKGADQIYNVLPGDKITVGPIEFPIVQIVEDYSGDVVLKSYDFSESILANSITADSVKAAKYVRFRIQNIDGNYTSDGVSVKAGDPLPVFIPRVSEEEPDPILFPVVSKKIFFGTNLLIAWAGGDNQPFQAIDLSAYPIDQQEFDINNSILKSQGDILLKALTFKHTYQMNSPFEDIMLETNNNKIYFNDAIAGGGGIIKWTEEYVTFTLTNPEKMNHGTQNNIRLKVLRPKQEVSGMWFNLISVDAIDQHADSVSTYTELVPSEILLEDSPIQGTVYDFICDDVDGNGTCD